jgi:hypothetical protein
MERMKQLTLLGKVGAVFKGGLAALTMDPYRLLVLTLESEVDGFLKAAPSARLKGIFLHDVIVDLCVALRLGEIIRAHVEAVADRYGAKPGLCTKNFARLVGFLEQNDFPTGELMIMAPFNSLGFQMNPSRQACEQTLAERGGLDVLARGLLSAGILDLESAVAYVKTVRNLRSVVVAASRDDYARTTFAAFKELKKMAPSFLSPA